MNEAKQPLGKWSDEEDKRLLAMYEDGEPIVKIASVDYADTAKISVTSKGTIKVERAKNVKCQLEQETPE